MTTLTENIPGATSLVTGLDEPARYEFVTLSATSDRRIQLPDDGRLRSILVTRGAARATTDNDDRTFGPLEGFHTSRPAHIVLHGTDDEPATLLIAGTQEKGAGPDVSLLELDSYTVDKPWGHETWYTQNIDNAPYALKQIHMKAGFQSSLQSHDIKTETNVIVQGRAKVHNGVRAPEDPTTPVEVEDIPAQIHDEGSSWTSPKRILHRVIAQTDYTAIEVSTPELDDVVRWSDDANRGHGRISSEHRNANTETRDLIELYFLEQEEVRRRINRGAIRDLFEAVLKTYRVGGTIFAAANGGNAGTLDHFACDFKYHPFVSDDKSVIGAGDAPPLHFVNLTASASELTGLTNDRGFDGIFKHALRGRIGANDLLLAFSGSGNSANILAAIQEAQASGARVFSLSKGDGGKAARLADIAIVVEGTSTFPGQTGGNDNNFHFEDIMLSLNHMIIGLLRNHLTARS